MTKYRKLFLDLEEGALYDEKGIFEFNLRRYPFLGEHTRKVKAGITRVAYKLNGSGPWSGEEWDRVTVQHPAIPLPGERRRSRFFKLPMPTRNQVFAAALIGAAIIPASFYVSTWDRERMIFNSQGASKVGTIDSASFTDLYKEAYKRMQRGELYAAREMLGKITPSSPLEFGKFYQLKGKLNFLFGGDPLEPLNQAIDFFNTAGTPKNVFATKCFLILYHLRNGDGESANSLFLELDEPSTSEYKAIYLRAEMQIAKFEKDYERALELGSRCIDAFRKTDSSVRIIDVNRELAEINIKMGNLDTGRRLAADVQERSIQLDNFRKVYYNKVNLYLLTCQASYKDEILAYSRATGNMDIIFLLNDALSLCGFPERFNEDPPTDDQGDPHEQFNEDPPTDDQGDPVTKPAPQKYDPKEYNGGNLLHFPVP